MPSYDGRDEFAEALMAQRARRLLAELAEFETVTIGPDDAPADYGASEDADAGAGAATEAHSCAGHAGASEAHSRPAVEARGTDVASVRASHQPGAERPGARTAFRESDQTRRDLRAAMADPPTQWLSRCLACRGHAKFEAILCDDCTSAGWTLKLLLVRALGYA